MDANARKAIAHLAEALYLLSCVRDPGHHVNVPIQVGDNRIMVTPKTAEALADAVDSMNAYMSNGDVIEDKLSIAARQAGSLPPKPDTASETIGSGEWSAAAVAQCNPDLYADVTDLFAGLDPIEITDKVIRDRQADLPDVAHLLDELFGDIPYPYADDEVPLPHDQAQMDALTAEVENHLKDGEA